MNVTERITALAGRFADHDDRWLAAFRATPRHLFVPARAWAYPDDGGSGTLLDRSADPEAWLDAIYSDVPIGTQLNDGNVDIATETGECTCSCSMPSAVLAGFELLRPFDGDEVLDIGTGTGWTAALLAHRLGDDNVTSVEIDETLHRIAAANLRQAGRSPRLILGDGAKGAPDGAPYDHVHVTCGVDDVPYSWVEQARPGATIVFPWMPPWEGGHLTALTVTGEGTAVGRFHCGVAYMMLRSQRWTPARLQTPYRDSSTHLDPRRVVRASYGADIAMAAMVPGVLPAYADQDAGEFHLTLWARDSDAQIHYSPEYKRSTVLQRGPRDLWDEVAAAYLRWISWGSPGRDRFGMTVTPEGRHIWLDSPAHPIA